MQSIFLAAASAAMLVSSGADARVLVALPSVPATPKFLTKLGLSLREPRNAPKQPAHLLQDVVSCNTASSLGKNFVPTTNASAPVSGDYLGLTFDFDLEQVITGGQVYYNCTVNGFLPYNTVDDLCTDQEDGPDPCPLGVGHHTDTGVVPATSGITKVKCTIQWVTEAWEEIICATASWTISK